MAASRLRGGGDPVGRAIVEPSEKGNVRPPSDTLRIGALYVGDEQVSGAQHLAGLDFRAAWGGWAGAASLPRYESRAVSAAGA